MGNDKVDVVTDNLVASGTNKHGLAYEVYGPPSYITSRWGYYRVFVDGKFVPVMDMGTAVWFAKVWDGKLDM